MLRIDGQLPRSTEQLIRVRPDTERRFASSQSEQPFLLEAAQSTPDSSKSQSESSFVDVNQYISYAETQQQVESASGRWMRSARLLQAESAYQQVLQINVREQIERQLGSLHLTI